MARLSTIDRLPLEIKDKIGALRSQGRTIDEILDKLNELSVDISRSALGRHCKRLESIQSSIRQSRTIAEAIVRNYGEDSENKVPRANIEILHSILFRMMGSEDGSPVTIDAKEAMFLATSLEKLSKASSLDMDKELKIRKEAEIKANKKALAALTKVAKNNGFSDDMLEQFNAVLRG